jgi:hypothetical protein
MNGGKRPGAGRPKGHAPSFTDQAQAFRLALLNAVVTEQDAIISAIVRNLMQVRVHAPDNGVHSRLSQTLFPHSRNHLSQITLSGIF